MDKSFLVKKKHQKRKPMLPFSLLFHFFNIRQFLLWEASCVVNFVSLSPWHKSIRMMTCMLHFTVYDFRISLSNLAKNYGSHLYRAVSIPPQECVTPQNYPGSQNASTQTFPIRSCAVTLGETLPLFWELQTELSWFWPLRKNRYDLI